jgi:hypothetical protein
MQGVPGQFDFTVWGLPGGRATLCRLFGFQASVSVNKYGATLLALLSFFVEGPSAVSAASAIISHPPFGIIFAFGEMSSLRARAGASIIDKCD